LSSLIAAGRRQ